MHWVENSEMKLVRSSVRSMSRDVSIFRELQLVVQSKKLERYLVSFRYITFILWALPSILSTLPFNALISRDLSLNTRAC